MTDADLDEHFPRATREQRIAIPIYHDAGWTINEMLPDSDDIRISRPAGEWVDHALIRPSGNVMTA